VELQSATSTDLTTVTQAFLSCDQSTWQVKGLQRIHKARCQGHPGGVIPCSSRLPPLYPNPWASRAGRYATAEIADRSVVSMVQRDTSHNKPGRSVDLGFSLWSWRRAATDDEEHYVYAVAL